MKEDEKLFFKECCERISNHGLSKEENQKRGVTPNRLFGGLSPITPREIINEPNFPINYKRAWYLLEKWSGKDWYDYGVTLDLGWITKEGNEAYIKMFGSTN